MSHVEWCLKMLMLSFPDIHADVKLLTWEQKVCEINSFEMKPLKKVNFTRKQVKRCKLIFVFDAFGLNVL